MVTPSEKQAKIIIQFENALSDMTGYAYIMTKNKGAIDKLDFIFNILEENKIQVDIHPANFDDEVDIITVKAKNLWEEDPSAKITRLKSALFTMSNYVRRMFKDDGMLDEGHNIVFGILESNGIG